LHASDLEGGVDAIQRAPNFAALVDALEDQFENTLILSGGDNVIPGPFFNAALFADDAIFNTAHNEIFGLSGDELYEALEGARGRIDISVMNAIGFDASALGNHEFDLGTDTLADLITPDFGDAGLADDEWVGTTFPYLSANLDFSNDSNLNDLATNAVVDGDAFVSGPQESAAVDGGAEATDRLAPAAVFQRGGEDIGVVGATTPILASISSPGRTEVVGPTSNDMPALAQLLQPVINDIIDGDDDQAGTGDDVNKVILVSHLQQIALEEELIGLLNGVDVVLASGSDTLLADETDTLRSGDTADRGYPIITQNADGDPAAIVSTDGEYSYVGRLVVEFDDNGVLVTDSIDPAVSGAFATTDEVVRSVDPDADTDGDTDGIQFAEGSKGAIVEGLVSGVTNVVNEQDGNVFGQTSVYLDGRRSEVRTEETNLGNLTADANLATAKQVDDTVVVSLKNGGGIRAPIGEVDADGTLLPPQGNAEVGKDEGDISQLDITNALRFNNALTLITLSPEQLLQVLEHGVAETAEGATPGQFPQVGGVSFRFDPDAEAGSRVQSAALIDDDGNRTQTIVENGAVVEDAPSSIRVVTLNFLAGGGDDYPFQEFVAANPTFANRVDLVGEEDEDGDGELDADEDLNLNGQLDGPVDLAAGSATFANAGTEQDALAEFLAANFNPDTGGTPFGEAETPPAADSRIQDVDSPLLPDTAEAVTFGGASATRGSTTDGRTGEEVEVIVLNPAANTSDSGVAVTVSNDVSVTVPEGLGITTNNRVTETQGNLRTVLDGDLGGQSSGDTEDFEAFLDDVLPEADGSAVNVTQLFPIRSEAAAPGEAINLTVDVGDGTTDDGRETVTVIDVTGLLGEDGELIGALTITVNGDGPVVIKGDGTFNGGEDASDGDGDQVDIDNILGDNGDQVLVFGPGPDVIRGGGGDDTVSSAGGDDRLFGGSGNDTLTGGADDDTLDGGAGRDVAAFGVTFADATIDGARTGGSVTGEGNDTLQGGVEILTFSDNRSTVTTTDTPFAVEGGGRAVVDEDFYLEVNRDVAEAVENGVFASGAQHFRFHGFEEGRDPNALFDQAYYLSNNSDVSAAVDAGTFQSAYDHYRQFGAEEGRASSQYFDTQDYLDENEDVAAAADFINGLDHFLLFGLNEGRSGFLVDM
jgi:2',3'-cyclic-nucleotide 2'-phosphodiesterase (5'-nucleotidase family)